LILDIRLEEVSIALYEEDTLSPSSTRVWSLADPDLTASTLMKHLLSGNEQAPPPALL
jgi:hypothetical protein